MSLVIRKAVDEAKIYVNGKPVPGGDQNTVLKHIFFGFLVLYFTGSSAI